MTERLSAKLPGFKAEVRTYWLLQDCDHLFPYYRPLMCLKHQTCPRLTNISLVPLRRAQTTMWKSYQLRQTRLLEDLKVKN